MGKRQIKKLDVAKRNLIMSTCKYYIPTEYKNYSCGENMIFDKRCLPTEKCINNIDDNGKNQLTILERRFKMINLMKHEN